MFGIAEKINSKHTQHYFVMRRVKKCVYVDK